jgi:importin-7
LRADFHFDSTYDYGEDEEWADEEANWTGDEGAAEPQEGGGQLKDESAAYLEFLNDEVSLSAVLGLHLLDANHLFNHQAQKFSRVIDDDEDDPDLGEDNFLDSPLDKVEPYQLFKSTMISKWLLDPA